MKESGGQTRVAFLLALVAVAACAGEPTRPRLVAPRADESPPCGTQDDPCLIDAIYVIASPAGSSNPWTPCTSIPGGCFPKNDPTTPIVWGYTYAGGGWPPPLNAPGTGNADGSSVPLRPQDQLLDVQFVMKGIKCAQLRDRLSSLISQGRIFGSYYSDPNEWGNLAPSSETIFISIDKHWNYDPGTDTYMLINADSLRDTLVHEAGHDWFSPALTPDTIPTNINIVTANCD